MLPLTVAGSLPPYRGVPGGNTSLCYRTGTLSAAPPARWAHTFLGFSLAH
jgi:hypothetical protein